MADMQWYYTPYGGAEQNLLSANVRMLTYDGFGLPRRIPNSTRMPLMDGVHHLDDEIYTPERYMHLVLLVEGTDYSNWKANDDALLAKLIGMQETSEMGTLRIVKPNGDVRTIQCALLEYPNDHGMNYNPWASKRVLTFYAPRPYFMAYPGTATYYMQAIDGVASGYLYPVSFPWGGYTTLNYLTGTVANNGNARTWPIFLLNGPATHPLFINATTNQWCQCTEDIAAAEYMVLDMEEGEYTIYGREPQLVTSAFLVGSTIWDLQVGNNTVVIAAPDMVQGPHYIVHQDAYKAL